MLALRFDRKEKNNSEQEDKKDRMLPLPADVEEEWHDIVATVVRDRVSNLPKEGRIELFFQLEDRQQKNVDLTNIIMTEAARALNELVLSPVSQTH